MKLYKRVDGELHYWQTWDIDDKKGAIQKGIVGQRGDYKEIKSGLLSSFRKVIQKEVDNYCEDGYEEVADSSNKCNFSNLGSQV